MKCLLHLTSSLAARVGNLIREAELAHPGMQEVAGMVYVGDVYALRVQTAPARNDGWGTQCYVCDEPDHL
jgi:hypothetical protein